MDDPDLDDPLVRFLREAGRADRNARRFLVALARFNEVYEAWEEQQIDRNPWLVDQVAEN